MVVEVDVMEVTIVTRVIEELIIPIRITMELPQHAILMESVQVRMIQTM